MSSEVAHPADVVSRDEVSSRWSRFVGLVALVEFVLLYAPTIAWLFERWTLSVWHHAHGLLIPPVVGYFIYQELRPLSDLPRRSSAWGFALLVPALAMRALDAGMHTELLSAASLVVALPGLSLLLIGMERTRRILFPLCFLAFALPIPLGVTEQLHWQLRLVATAGAAWAMPLLGIPVYVEGTTLHLARQSLQVADSCSGFSTLYAAVSVACLTAYTARSTPRRILVLLGAAPIAIASNVLRVILLAVMVVWKGDEILETFVHPLSGMMTFALALPIIFWLGGEFHRERRS